jgi:hypothetical protein
VSRYPAVCEPRGVEGADVGSRTTSPLRRGPLSEM